MITYRMDKEFKKEDVEALFKSIGWESGNYPNRLYKALQNSQTVVTAYDSFKLVGLARAIDDGAMLSYIHYVLVDTNYRRMGIARNMINMIKDKYKDYMYIKVIPASKESEAFYNSLGFNTSHHGVAQEIKNINIKDF
jgi:ribosomal protein S18 acetylase RimI-like enzyme